MAYSVEVKKDIVEQMKNKKISDIAKETGISLPTLYKWKRDYENKVKETEEVKEQEDNNNEEPEKVEDMGYRKGRDLYKQRKYKEAKEFFKDSIKNKGSDYIRSIFFLGKIYVFEHRYKDARECFNRYIEIDKDKNPHAHLELGKLEIIEGNYKKAREEFNRCIEIDEDKNPHAHLELGKLEVIEGNLKEAREQFNRCMEINENDRYAQVELEKLNELEKAKQTYSSKFTNKKADILSLIRAKIYEETIINDDIEQLKKERELINAKRYYLIMAAIYEKLGQKKNALDVIKQMQEEGIKVKGIETVKQRLKSKRRQQFNLASWDELIGWSTIRTDIYEEERKKHELSMKPVKLDINQPKNTDFQEKRKDETRTIPKRKKSQIIISEGKPVTSRNIVQPKRVTTSEKKSKKRDVSTNTSKVTIYQTINISTKKAIEEISLRYYLNMQPVNKEIVMPKEYYESLEGINKVNTKEKQKRMQSMNTYLQNAYKDAQRIEKFTKKYDKLQSILSCQTTNKRAQMELMLILINEGYDDVARLSFPKEDYEFINNLIAQYCNNTKSAKETRDSIDEYCI